MVAHAWTGHGEGPIPPFLDDIKRRVSEAAAEIPQSWSKISTLMCGPSRCAIRKVIIFVVPQIPTSEPPQKRVSTRFFSGLHPVWHPRHSSWRPKYP